MIVEVNGTIVGEQRSERFVGQRVRVAATSTENHKVGDVHDPHAKFRNKFAQEGGGGDDLEGDLHTDADENDIGVDALIDGGKPPNRCTRDTML